MYAIAAIALLACAELNTICTLSRVREMNSEKVRADFDQIARLEDARAIGSDRYDAFLLDLVPPHAVDVLEIGCGLGRLANALATGNREVTGMDLSPLMIARAGEQSGSTARVSFLCGDFLEHDFGSRQFDCIISAAMLHHVPEDIAVPRMIDLLRPRGRLVIHDLRDDAGLLDRVRSLFAFAQQTGMRLARTGRARSPRRLRQAWENHGAGETYLTLQGAQALADRLLPGARVFHHWLWRYTIVWDKP